MLGAGEGGEGSWIVPEFPPGRPGRVMVAVTRSWPVVGEARRETGREAGEVGRVEQRLSPDVLFTLLPSCPHHQHCTRSQHKTYFSHSQYASKCYQTTVLLILETFSVILIQKTSTFYWKLSPFTALHIRPTNQHLTWIFLSFISIHYESNFDH